MVTLRCTQNLLRRVRSTSGNGAPSSTTLLGDWYAKRIVARPAHLILCVSERTLLPVVFPAAPIGGLAPRFGVAVADVFRALGIGASAILGEMMEMADVTFAATANRRVLGSMNDFQRMLPYHLEAGESLLEASLHLSRAPCGPIGMKSPDAITRQIFGGAAH
jgi:hypothetical protein